MDNKEFYNFLPEYVIRIQKEKGLDYNEEELEKSNLKQKRVTFNAIKLSNGDIYLGEWNKFMKMEGLGIMLKSGNEKVLEGIWQEDNFIKGRIYFADGTYYEGLVSPSFCSPNGEGIFYGLDYTYTGDFHMGKKQGQGKIIFSDATKFSGRFEDDQAVSGNIIWPNGCSYHGDVKNFSLGQNGLFTTNTGNVYQGSWGNNKLDGLGKFTWKSPNHIFEGHYKNSKKEGPGVYYFNYPNIFFSGLWFHDKPHGPGEYQDDKKVVIGLWRYGKLLQVFSYTTKKTSSNSNLNSNLNEKSGTENKNEKLSVKEIEDDLNLRFQKEDVDTKSLAHLKHEYDYSHTPNQTYKAIKVERDRDNSSYRQAESMQSSLVSKEPVEKQASQNIQNLFQNGNKSICKLESMISDEIVEKPKELSYSQILSVEKFKEPKETKELSYSQIHSVESTVPKISTTNENFNQIFKVQEVAYVPDYKNNEIYDINRKNSS
jgi:hypothetical protein